ncbi:toll/interleukin-1 receptor domain-containing protein [Crateriforma conspicua]|uniref:toll/interleukin-1 receptor domain-containing protein n=1 Tax=Crateriforma conspicua TaxID=2527996 RepID=UPI0011880A98|nr:toll/interleukin-1 receptor domain-containing protein [Crateriforma conspicua]QDV61965.1 hypothetical protein Mal65_10930 [Crateriforma conspicua]
MNQSARLLSEPSCMAILSFAAAHVLEQRRTSGSGADRTEEVVSRPECFKDPELYRALLPKFDLTTIDAALRWLTYCDYLIGSKEVNFGGQSIWTELTEKGRAAAKKGELAEEDRRLLHGQEEPHEVFIAHQFNTQDSELVSYIRGRVLEPAGFNAIDGRADGLEAFRTAIVEKIRRARFFVCLLTKRNSLTAGGSASSVWLYQETGVAVAFGKRPLLLVEEGIDREYVGELQSIYEHIVFSRSNHPDKFDSIRPRLENDLKANDMALPKASKGSRSR